MQAAVKKRHADSALSFSDSSEMSSDVTKHHVRQCSHDVLRFRHMLDPGKYMGLNRLHYLGRVTLGYVRIV